MLNKYRVFIFFMLALGVVALYVWLAADLYELGFPNDDAWIHQTYARNFAEQGKWTYVEGKTSVASTSPLYGVLLALGFWVGINQFAWTYFIGVLSLTLGAELAARLAEKLYPQVAWVGLLTGLFFVLSWQLIWAGVSGMETLLFAALCLGVPLFGFYELAPQRRPTPPALLRRGVLLGLYGGLLTFTRPEGMLLVGLVGLGCLLALGRRALLWGVGVALGWLVIMLPYAAWNYSEIGEPFPSTMSAKIAEYVYYREIALPLRVAMMAFVTVVGAQILLVPAALWSVVTVRHPIGRVLWVWFGVHLMMYAVVLPLPHQNGRYILPIVPILLVFGVGAVAELWGRYRQNRVGRVLMTAYALSLPLLLVAFVWIGGKEAYAKQVRLYNTDVVETARWIKDNVPDDELMVTHDIGALGFYAPRPLLDSAGLISPELIPILRNKPALVEAVCQAGAKWLMARPDQRMFPPDDPRIRVVFASPYPYHAQAIPREDGEPNKMRVYEINCDIDS